MTEAEWAEFTKSQEILVCMRFSYFGNSGWKSEFSKDKDLLFAEDRISNRMSLFAKIPLPSLAAQSDQNFHLFILTSEDLPEWAINILAETAAESLALEQFTILAAPVGNARTFLRKFMTKRYGKRPVMQTVLDDDDGLAVDFLASTRVEMSLLASIDQPMAMRFVSYANGFGLDLGDGDAAEYSLFRHRYPYINLGLTMASPSDGQNVFSINHRYAPRKNPCRLVRGVPMYVRTIHQANDSRVSVSEFWKPIGNWRKSAEILQQFPYLADI